MQVRIDSAACQGHGRCALTAPEVFDVDDDGKSFVLVVDVPEAEIEAVRTAVGNCPERAITTE
jgi:ferredoxin